MKVGKTSEKEISELFNFMNELSWLADEFRTGEFEHIDWNEFDILKTFDREDPNQFMSDLARYAKSLFYERVLTNCQVLLDNCADPNERTLEFNPDIKKGLELLESQKEGGTLQN